jgi:hypothetical protein
VKQSETKVVLKRRVRLSADDWSEVGDLIAQCIEAADVDESYARHVRNKAIVLMVRIRNEAVDNGLRKKAEVSKLEGMKHENGDILFRIDAVRKGRGGRS